MADMTAWLYQVARAAPSLWSPVMIEASCHCGGVRLRVPAAPDTITDCNCSICRRLGTLWAYYQTADVVFGPPDATAIYMWGDRTLEIHRCKACGCTTHWQGVGEFAHRVGINARLFDPEVLAALPIRRFDGAAKPVGGD
jgi:hypothetical protein